MLSQLMVLFGFAALVLVMVYWVNQLVALFDRLIGDGQPLAVFLEFSALTLPGIVRIVLPLAAFAASLYVTNRMTAESELIVVQATGYSAFRLARPVLAFGLIVALMMSALTHFLVPTSVSRLNARQAEIASDTTARLLREGQFMSPADGVTIYIRDITPEGELRDLFLSDSRNADRAVTYTAARAFLVRTDGGPQLVMVDGMVQMLQHADQRLFLTSFGDLAYDIGALMQVPDTSRRSARELMTHELLAPTPALVAETGKPAGALIVEGHERFSQALLAVVAALIGFATLLIGGFSRFGVWRQIILAIGLLIAVKLVETVVTGPVRAQPVLWPLIYLPAATGLGIGWFLLFWTTRPALFARRRPAAGATR